MFFATSRIINTSKISISLALLTNYSTEMKLVALDRSPPLNSLTKCSTTLEHRFCHSTKRMMYCLLSELGKLLAYRGSRTKERLMNVEIMQWSCSLDSWVSRKRCSYSSEITDFCRPKIPVEAESS